ncbi:hypothetical protein [Flavobacterium mesophilum]|uniref:hypothetical protein n=1 Tax=Flavobacterium mesophilum TaxID=3143495 RepID=UPI0031D2EA39
MSTTPTEYKYYPALSDLMKPEDLPDFLSFIKDGLQDVFQKMYYKDYQTSKSTSGSSAFYSLDVISRTKLALELPGTGVFFVLNPDYEDTTISSFPITVFWEWEVMRYIRYFNANGFSFSVEDFYDLALTVLKISEEQIIQLAINTFVIQSSPALSKFGQLVQDINTLYGTTIAIDETSDNSLQELIVQVNLLDKKVAPAIFSLYLLSTDLSETKAKVKTFFSSFIPNDIEEYIKKIITPKARVTLELAAAIEFPRKILVPWKNNGTERDEDETHIARFQFAKALLYADTEAGMGYNLELAGTLSPPFCEIGKSGMLIQVENLKLDLSKKTNIAEADADGRPKDFVGVYARAASVTLPSKWFHDFQKEGQGNTATTLRIGASDLLIGTGGLSGDIYLETVPVSTGVFSYFGDKFDFDYPLTMLQENEETEVIEIKQIADYDELLVYLQELNAKSSIAYPFSYPLKLTTKSTLISQEVNPSTVYTFKNAKEYQAFLSKLVVDNTLWKTIGSPSKGFNVGFNKFDISFKQNKVISSNIKGALEINKFKYPKGHPLEGKPMHVDIEGHLHDDGDFNLTASFQKGGEPQANLFDFVNFKFNSLELGKEDNDYYIGTACEVKFTNDVMKQFMGDQSIIIEKLRIYSDGNIELEGGTIPIPLNLSLNLGPVQMSVSNINFGSTQIVKNGVTRKYNFWGFDGAISINPLGLDARGEGVKYYYTTDDGEKDSFLRIQTIEVDLMIPGTATASSAMAIIHGMISLPEPGKSQEFMGEVSLKLPKAKISGGVGMRFMPKYPAFLVDAHIELPTPIPLGFLSISAFRGLLGFRYVATKEAAGLTKDNSWYEFYKHPKPGINIRKFSGPPASMQYKAPFSIGAGATFGTTADGGYILSLRAMLLLSLPTLFYIEAGLNVIAGRLGLVEDDPSNPPFFAMVAFGDDSLELAAGADFSIPKDSGAIFQLHALLESGFFFKNQKPWYVNLGSKKDPITARVLSLFTAKSFIMISAQGIEAGARLDFKLKQSFGPAKVELWAYLELGGKISFKRPQMGGYITAGGGIRINIWIINIEIVLDTIFSVESFKPFLIYAKIELSVRVKIGFIKVRKNFKIELQWDINRVIDRSAYSPLPLGTEGDKGANGEKGDNRSTESVKGVHMLTNEAFPLYFSQSIPNVNEITQTIPLDTYIDIKLSKGVKQTADVTKKIGGYTSPPNNYTLMMPPDEKAAGRPIRQVKHEFSIKEIELKSWVIDPVNPNTGSWKTYSPFEAVVESDERTDELKNLPWAYWQKAIDQYDSIRVLATNPFSFTSAGEPGWHVPEQYGITPSKLFCESEKLKKECTDFLNKKIGQRYYIPSQYEADKINGLYFKLIGTGQELDLTEEEPTLIKGDFMSITGENNPFGINRSLSFKNDNQLEIIFPEAAIEPTLKLTTHAAIVKIKAYTAVLLNDNDKFPTYIEVDLKKTENGPITNELVYSKEELLSEITLFAAETDAYAKTKIDKILITPVSANAKRISEIRAELAALLDAIFENDEIEDKEAAVSNLITSTAYIDLTEELENLKTQAGNDNATPVGLPDQLTFTRYYGYKGKASYKFDQIIKFNDTYLVSFHPQVNTTAIVQLDSNGKIVRERLFNGILTSMQVVNDNLVVTQALDAKQCKGINEAIIDDDFIVGCDGPIASTAILELDADLNKTFGLQYSNTFSLGFNKLLALTNNDLLWINTLENENETQINWVDGNDRLIVNRVTIDELAIKLIEHSTTEFGLVTKDKKIINFSINTTAKTVSVNTTKVISDVNISEITDAVIANGKIILTTKMANGKFGLATINGTSVNIFTNDAIFDSAIYLSNNTLSNNSIIAYNSRYMFVFNTALELTRLIERGTSTDAASIITIHNEPSANEILMLSNKPNEKGVYFSLFNDQFDNCALHPQEASDIISITSTLTSAITNVTPLGNTNTFEHKLKVKNSKLITINDSICSNGSDPNEDPELTYTTFIQKVCWINRENYLYNQNIPPYAAVVEDKKAMVAGIEKTVQPIWRPNTTYYLHFTLEDNISGRGAVTFEYYYGFKTLGPVGHFPIPDPKLGPGESNPPKNGLSDLAKSPLASLRQYLDYNRSYPNADGSLLQAKPVYYGSKQCKLSLYFTNPYTYHMLKDWAEYDSRNEIKGALNITIKDPLNDLIIDYPLDPEITYPFPTPDDKGEDTGWVSDNDPRIPNGIKLLNNLIEAINNPANSNENAVIKCELQLGDPLKPKSYAYAAELRNLKPSKLYTLLVNNSFGNEQKLVHQFGFQTSRYENFQEQVLSYTIDETESRKALFDVTTTLEEDQIAALYHLVAGESGPNTLTDSIATKYQHVFDRAIEGVLKLSPLDPAQTTEVNRIIDTNTGETIALLVRNPEPFNIPKMPLEEVSNTIKVINSEADVITNPDFNQEYKVLHSKDYAQVLIMHSSRKITASDLNLRFELRTWNNNGEKLPDNTVPLTLRNDESVTILKLENLT